MARRHVVISGTGRSGTTFLVQLLTRLGLDTGFNPRSAESEIHELARAGLEQDIRKDDSPYVVKDPWFCDYAHKVVSRDDIVIDHLFIPVRDLHAAAESRRQVFEATVSDARLSDPDYEVDPAKIFPGALWHTQSMERGHQEEVLLQQLYKLLLVVSGTTIPVTLMRFPRLINDCPYLFEKLRPILGEITYEEFESAFNGTVRPDLVHRYNNNDR